MKTFPLTVLVGGNIVSESLKDSEEICTENWGKKKSYYIVKFRNIVVCGSEVNRKYN